MAAPALKFFSAIISSINPIVRPPHYCPDCRCDNDKPPAAPIVSQPAVQHRRCCLRHHLKTTQDAHTRIFESEDVKDRFIGLFTGGLRSRNDDYTSRLHLSKTQRQALKSWKEKQPQIASSTSAHSFPLTTIFDIYNDVFFDVALRGRVDVLWTDDDDDCPGEGQRGYSVDADGPSHRATIFIQRPQNDQSSSGWVDSASGEGCAGNAAATR